MNNTPILHTRILLTLSQKLLHHWPIKIAFLQGNDRVLTDEVREQISSARQEYQEELTRLKNMTSYKNMNHFFGKFDKLRGDIDRRFNKRITYLQTNQNESPTTPVESVSHLITSQILYNTPPTMLN